MPPMAATPFAFLRGSAGLMAYDLAHMLELLRDPLIGGNDGVEGIADLAGDTGLVPGQAHRKIPRLHGMQGVQQLVLIEFRRTGGMTVRGRLF